MAQVIIRTSSSSRPNPLPVSPNDITNPYSKAFSNSPSPSNSTTSNQTNTTNNPEPNVEQQPPEPSKTDVARNSILQLITEKKEEIITALSNTHNNPSSNPSPNTMTPSSSQAQLSLLQLPVSGDTLDPGNPNIAITSRREFKLARLRELLNIVYNTAGLLTDYQYTQINNRLNAIDGANSNLGNNKLFSVLDIFMKKYNQAQLSQDIDESNINSNNVNNTNSNSAASLLNSIDNAHTTPFDPLFTLRDILLQQLSLTLEYEWDQLYSNLPTSDGKKISRAERLALGLNQSALVYGEVSYQALSSVLWSEHIQLSNTGENCVFVDLGSGTGRAVFAASVIHNFSLCIGIEILHGLHEAAQTILLKHYKLMNNNNSTTNSLVPNQRIEFYHGSFLEFDWTHADLVLANSTCFDDELMNDITKLAENMKIGSYIITLTKKIDSKLFQCLNSTIYSQSWGFGTIHIHKRIDPNAKPVVNITSPQHNRTSSTSSNSGRPQLQSPITSPKPTIILS